MINMAETERSLVAALSLSHVVLILIFLLRLPPIFPFLRSSDLTLSPSGHPRAREWLSLCSLSHPGEGLLHKRVRMLQDAMVYPPMLPLIAHDAKFVFATDLEVQQFASNAALVAQVHDSLACWLSHIKDIHTERSLLLEWLDTLQAIDPIEVEPKLMQLELVLSFHLHFDRREVLACTRLLQYAPKAARQLEALATELEVIKTLHEEIQQSLQFVSGVCAYVRTPWDVRDVSDTIGPLFSALRALWVCSPLFGPLQGHSRFSAMVAFVVQRVEVEAHNAGCDVVDRMVASPSAALGIKQRLVAAQDALVAVQEQFYELKSTLSSCGIMGGLSIHAVLSDVDDAALFSLAEWYFERIKGLLMCVDVLRHQPDKIGSALTDPLCHVDLMDPDIMGQPTFLHHLDEMIHEESPSADAILSRMDAKQQLIGKSAPPKNNAATAAPRIPFDQLCGGLCVTLAFNPPVITIMGGPVSVGFLDSAQYSLPMCCSNTQSRGAMSRKATDAVFVCLGKNVQQLSLRGLFCDEVHIVSMLTTLLDLLEAEDAWKMMDSLGQHIDGQEVHTIHFRKHRSKKKRRGGGSRSRSLSPLSNNGGDSSVGSASPHLMASGTDPTTAMAFPDGYDPSAGSCLSPVESSSMAC
jgi:hypothetical protein